MKVDSFVQKMHSRRFNGNAVLSFDIEVVGRRGTIVHVARLFAHTRDMEQPFGDRRLARVDVRENADVPDRRRYRIMDVR